MSAEPPNDSAGSPIVTALTGVFEDVTPQPAPEAVLLMGGPGAAPGRAVAHILAGSSEPMAILRAEDLAALLGGADRDEAAEVLRAGLLHALREKLPSVVDDPQIAASPDDVLEAFKAAGFSTRIALTVDRDVTSALTISTRQLRSHAIGAPRARPRTIADEWDRTMETLRGIPTTTLERITVIGGDGAAIYDGVPSIQAWATVQGARRAPLSGMQGVAWLSELRRIGEYVRSARDSLTRDDVVAIEQLYAVAQRKVLPELPIRPGSVAATVQRERLQAERAQLKRLMGEIDLEVDTSPSTRRPGPDVSR